MSKALQYGSLYFMVGRPGKTEQEIAVFADRVEIQEGHLIFWGGFRAEKHPQPDEGNPEITIAFPPKTWTYVYEASCLDGRPLSVKYWKGLLHEGFDA